MEDRLVIFTRPEAVFLKFITGFFVTDVVWSMFPKVEKFACSVVSEKVNFWNKIIDSLFFHPSEKRVNLEFLDIFFLICPKHSNVLTRNLVITFFFNLTIEAYDLQIIGLILPTLMISAKHAWNDLNRSLTAIFRKKVHRIFASLDRFHDFSNRFVNNETFC